ncbi:hypothetical protein PIB30_076745 [Stylosanthes scabra]|uniref:FAR1 domain-containing protein n=1 Tax=Stylosanthes scabra TaxID=79078 RepID=A0ABU6SQH7_9FABA|nr:hypothetical protein [Stylosanthes scabra]
MDFENFVDCCPDFIDEDSLEILRELTNVSQEQHHEVPSTEEALQHEEHGNQTSRVLAPIRSKKIASEKCKDRVYVKLDKEKGTWFHAIFEAKHTHACSPQKSLHYHEYRELNMHAKCVIEDNDEAGIRPNKTYLALSNEVGGASNLNFSEKDVRNYITCKLRTSDPNHEEAWKARKRKTELKEQKQSYSTNPECSRLGVAKPQGPCGLIQHPTPRRDARRLGVDEAARMWSLHQDLNA